MSESQSLLLESAERLFAEIGDAGAFDASWARISELGFENLLVAEAAGGFGGDWSDAFAVLRLAGAHALPLPLGEAIAAKHLSAVAGFAPLDGLHSIAQNVEGAVDAKGCFTGRVAAASWGGDAAAIVFDFEGGLVRAASTDARIERRTNPAGEVRDALEFQSAPVERADCGLSAFEAGAFMRVAQIAGALDAALSMSIAYANERSQFGKPIGKFQAVQQSLAVFAEECAAVNSVGQAAAYALDHGDGAFEIGAAKLRANMAASVGAAVAHQVHGAIGFTQEHALHRLTRRLASWRSEFGGERYWGERLGNEICARGADAFWPFLAARGDRV